MGVDTKTESVKKIFEILTVENVGIDRNDVSGSLIWKIFVVE